jgi:O-antigen ligase/tetratricopeptide (TPR) repeat protein
MIRSREGMAILFLALIACLVWTIQPSVTFVPGLILLGSIAAGWFMSGDRLDMKGIVHRAPVFLILFCAVLDYREIFPDRQMAVYVLAPVLAWFSGRCFKLRSPSLAGLILYVGLSAAPFTELHLEFNAWTLTILLYGLLQANSAGEFVILHRESRPVFLFSLVTAAAVCGIFTSVYPYATQKQAVILIVAGLVFILTLIHCRVTTRKHLIMVFLMTLAAIYSGFALGAGIHRIIHMGWSRGFFFRIFVFNRHPNYVIYPLLMILPLCLLWMERHHSARQRISASLVFFLSILYLLVYSYSREGWIVLAVYLLLGLMLFKSGPARKIVAGGLAGSAILVAISAFLSKAVYFRLVTIVNYAETSRFQAWRIFLQLFPDRPWTGFGLGTNRYIFPQAFGDMQPLRYPSRQFLVEAHNAYLDILIGMGMIGLCLFLLFLMSVVLPVLREKSFEGRCLSMLGIGLLVDLVFNFRLHVQDTGTMLMVLLGLVAAGGITSHASKRIRQRYRLPKWSVAVVSIVLTGAAGLPWMGKHYVSHAQSLLSKRDWNLISTGFNKAAKLEPLNAHPHYYLAHCAIENKNRTLAYSELQRAVQLNPNYAFYRYELALHLLSDGKPRLALKELETAKTLKPYENEGKVRFLSGALHLDVGSQATARKDLWIALMENPELAAHPFWKDHHTLFQRLISDCQTFFVREARYTDSVVRYTVELDQIARIYEYAGFPDRLYGLYESASILGIEYEEIVIQAVSFFIRQRDLDRAEQLLIRGLDHYPYRSSYYYLLGCIRYLQGDMISAQKTLEKADSLYDHISLDNRQGYEILARIYEETKQEDKLKGIHRKLAYLKGGRNMLQEKDLTIHAGSENMRYQLPDLNIH